MESIKIHDALKTEVNNLNDVYLYKGEDDYWYSFEKSAYLLTSLFPFVESFKLDHLEQSSDNMTQVSCSKVKLICVNDNNEQEYIRIKAKNKLCDIKYKDWINELG